MKNVAIVNCIDLSPYGESALPRGLSLKPQIEAFGRALPEVEKIVYLVNEGVTHWRGERLARAQWDLPALVDYLVSQRSYDHLFYFYGDCPLLDGTLAGKIYANHVKYFAQYSFADGYPYGLTPEILSRDLLLPLARLAEGCSGPIRRDSLFSLIEKDINAFDIETEISPTDLRRYRVSLTLDTHQHVLQLCRIIEAGGIDAPSVERVILKREDLLRTVPAYYQVQIIDKCAQVCRYSPFPKVAGDVLANRGEMDLQGYLAILNAIEQFSREAVLSISPWGEPGLHSRVEELVDETVKRESLTLLIETSGVGWDRTVLERLVEKHGKRIRWIISLDALDRDLYRTLRGEGYDEAYGVAMFLVEALPESAWVQAVRMRENEQDLESFYRFWREKTDKVIVQKYDWFCGFLEQKKVADLSPLKRFPCWHLKRDLFITLAGDVPLCREDLSKEYLLGNIWRDPLEEIWKKGVSFYRDHVQGIYRGLCATCDEYYTYNF